MGSADPFIPHGEIAAQMENERSVRGIWYEPST
jgi:hypothetical protein